MQPVCTAACQTPERAAGNAEMQAQHHCCAVQRQAGVPAPVPGGDITGMCDQQARSQQGLLH